MFGLLNWLDSTDSTNPIYQTQYMNLNLLIQIFSFGTKPNLLNQIYWTKFTKPYLNNCIYKIQSTKQNLWNVKKKQICWTKYIKSNILNKTCKLNSPNQFYQTKSRKTNLQKIKVKSNPCLYWVWPSSAPACFLHFFLYFLYFYSF